MQEGKRRSIARVTIALCLVSKIGMARLSDVNMVAAGDRTHPLRYCVIRGLSSVSHRLDGLDVQEGKRRSIARVTIDLCLDGPSRLWLYMALVMVSSVVADGGGCPESELRST